MNQTMAMRLKVFAMILCSAHAAHAVTKYQENLNNMEGLFFRSDKVHEQSMARISERMTSNQAIQVLQKANLTTSALNQVTLALKSNLRKQPKGYSGLDGARKLLNDMIFESMTKYDNEIAKCTEYYSKQCAQMNVCRGTIAASNYIAANSRSLILDAQSTINRCETDIPVRKQELVQHNMKCTHELQRLRTREAIVLGDIKIMTGILKMTDCEKKSFLQQRKLALIDCEETCEKTGKAPKNLALLGFTSGELRKVVSKIKSSAAAKLMKDAFADMAGGIQGLESLESRQEPVMNKTEFNNPPVPFTGVPGKPGPYPTVTTSKCGCSLAGSPMCYKLQGRFLLIQAGIQDEHDNLLKQIFDMEQECELIKGVLETDISNDEDMLSNAQTKLAEATSKEANAGETARTTAAQHDQLEADLKKQMKTCSDNYINFETELCALKKIRGELYKMKGGSDAGSAFFVDCEVTKWDPEECTKVCATGEQKLKRSVLTQPNGGAKCLPLAAERSCNNHPCPVDCKLHAWSGWSKCSAECGGGVQQRLREVERAMKYQGKPCGATSESRSCYAQACEKDCELSEWTSWTRCSKDCDGGTQKRQKFIANIAEGDGKCPDKWSSKRLAYKKCAMTRCRFNSTVMTCNKTLDVVLLIDGSAPMGKKGFANEIKAATQMIDAFSVGDTEDTKAQMAVILFSGPRTWTGVSQCTGKSAVKVDAEKVCKIVTVSHFTNNLKKLKAKVADLEFPKGGSLTSLALFAAKAELGLGEKNAQSVVVVFSSGRPLSYRKTGMASHDIRKQARLLWVAVSADTPLKSIKTWATRRWQENVVRVESFEELAKPSVITHVIANICPKKEPELEFSRSSSLQ